MEAGAKGARHKVRLFRIADFEFRIFINCALRVLCGRNSEVALSYTFEKDFQRPLSKSTRKKWGKSWRTKQEFPQR